MKSAEVIQKSRITPEQVSAAAVQPIDRLSALLGHFRLRARLFHTGPLCGRVGYESLPGRTFLHVLRQGTLTVRHGPGAGITPVMELREPTVLLYAGPLFHEFAHPSEEGTNVTCAMLEFDGAERNPIVQALPPLVCVPLTRIEGLQATLELLFAETDQVRCGSRVLADRLFEVVFIQLLRWILDHPEDVGITGGMIAGLSDARLARAIVAMHREPARAWTLGALASQAAMSRSAFAQAFRCATGITPAHYLTDWRLTLAASLLRAGRPAKRVAEDVGFAGPPSLSKAFRQRFGVAPRAWLAADAGA